MVWADCESGGRCVLVNSMRRAFGTMAGWMLLSLLQQEVHPRKSSRTNAVPCADHQKAVNRQLVTELNSTQAGEKGRWWATLESSKRERERK